MQAPFAKAPKSLFQKRPCTGSPALFHHQFPTDLAHTWTGTSDMSEQPSEVAHCCQRLARVLRLEAEEPTANGESQLHAPEELKNRSPRGRKQFTTEVVFPVSSKRAARELIVEAAAIIRHAFLSGCNACLHSLRPSAVWRSVSDAANR